MASINETIDPTTPAVIVVESGDTLTFGELETRSRRLAHLFRTRGLAAGGHVAVLLDNDAPLLRGVLGGATGRALPHAHQLAPRRRRGRLHRRRLRRHRPRDLVPVRRPRDRVGPAARSGHDPPQRRRRASTASRTTRRRSPTSPGAARRRDRGRADVLLVGHDGPAQGHPASPPRRPVRHRRRRSTCSSACTASAPAPAISCPAPLYHAAPIGWSTAVPARSAAPSSCIGRFDAEVAAPGDRASIG